MLGFYSVLALMTASLCNWMLSGSPLPLAFSGAVVIAGLALAQLPGKWILFRHIVSFLVPVLFGFTEWRLFESGRAMVSRAETPDAIHLSMALLWTASLLALSKSSQSAGVGEPLLKKAGLAGGALLAASASATILYDYPGWQAFPVASTPFVIYLGTLTSFAHWPFRKRSIGFVLLLATTTGFLFGSTKTTEFLRGTFGGRGVEEDIPAPKRPTSIGGTSEAMDGASRKLPRDGNVAFTHQIRIYAKPHSPELLRHWEKGPLYFRTATLTKFESDDVIAPLRSGVWLYDIDDGEEDGTIDFSFPGKGRLFHYSVFLDQKSSLSVPLAEGTRAVFASAVYEFADSWYQLSPPKEMALFRFSARAEVQSPTSAIRPLRGQDPNSVYLGMPPSPLSGRIRQLTKSFNQENPLSEIRRYLDGNVSYTLSFSTPDNMSAVENFLFGGRTGHCEHYGAATVLMLRSMGIPSRVAYGYTGGSVDRNKALFAFRDSDFHTWSEVLTEDHGWVIFDTVPEVENAAPRHAAIAKVPAVDPADYHDLSDVDIAGIQDTAWLSMLIDDGIALLARHFPSVILILGIAVAFSFWQLRRRNQQKESQRHVSTGESEDLSWPQYLEELILSGSDLGVSHHRRMTWKEFEAELRLKTPVPPEVSGGVDYYYSTRFAGKAPDRNYEKELAKQIRLWRNSGISS